MAEAERVAWGNPSSAHAFGLRSAELLREATDRLASALDVPPDNILYTSGATESNALAMTSLMRIAEHRRIHMIFSAFEHASVYEWRDELTNAGVAVSILEPDRSGVVTIDRIYSLLRPETIAVSLMAVQNELGTIQPIRELSQILRPRGILLHTDAAQAVGRAAIADITQYADLVVLSGHKCYGPKGIGALLVSFGASKIIRPLLHGGGQQRGLRSGTIAVPLVVGLVEAVLSSEAERKIRSARATLLESHLLSSVRARFPDVTLLAETAERALGIMSLRFPGVGADQLLTYVHGIAVSHGSACHSGAWAPSRAYLSIGLDSEAASECIRVCVGRETTMDDVLIAGERLGESAARLCKREKYG